MAKKTNNLIIPLKNLWKLPIQFAQNPEGYLMEVVNAYGNAYELSDRGRDVLFRCARKAYQNAGVFGNGISRMPIEKLVAMSENVNTEAILLVMSSEDAPACHAFRTILSDTQPINQYIAHKDFLHEQIQEAGDEPDKLFSKVVCPLCGGDAVISIQGISALETGTVHGGFVIRYLCKVQCDGSPMEYLVANDSDRAVYGKISDINQREHEFMSPPIVAEPSEGETADVR